MLLWLASCPLGTAQRCSGRSGSSWIDEERPFVPPFPPDQSWGDRCNIDRTSGRSRVTWIVGAYSWLARFGLVVWDFLDQRSPTFWAPRTDSLGDSFSIGPGVGAGNGFGVIEAHSTYHALCFWSNATADLTGLLGLPPGGSRPQL